MNKLLITVIGTFTTSIALAAPTSYQSAVLTDNPYVFYRLGESSGTVGSDSSGNGRDGTYVNGPTLGLAGGGAGSDTAAGFASAGTQRLTTSALAGFGQLLGTASWEFVFSTTTTGSQMELGGVLNTGSTTAWEVSLNRNAAGSLSANGIRLFLRDDNNNAIGASFSAPLAFDGNFHHLVFTYDETGVDNASRVLAYFDGVLQVLTFGGAGGNSTPGSGTLSSFNFDTTFGSRQNRATTDLFFNGTLDEAALYSSVLSPSQIFNHAGTVVPEPGTAAFGVLAFGSLLFARRRKR